jgi:hypothetical protein
MDDRIVGTTLGGCGTFLWFMPFASVGEGMYQAGNNIGGIAYLLLAAFVVASSLSWLRQYVPMLIAAGIACAVCTLFLVEAGSSVLWGLVASALIAASMVVSAIHHLRTAASPAGANNPFAKENN